MATPKRGSFTFTVLVGATASPVASPDASPVAAGIVNEDVVKAQMHEIADQAQQRATVEAANVDRLDEGDFLLAVLAGVGRGRRHLSFLAKGSAIGFRSRLQLTRIRRRRSREISI